MQQSAGIASNPGMSKRPNVQTSKPPAPQSEQRLQRISVARTMLEAGLPDKAILIRLQARFSCCRQSAHNYLNDAVAQLHASDDGPASNERSHTAAEIQAELAYEITRALACGDTDAACKLVKALDLAKRWQGQGQPDSAYH